MSRARELGVQELPRAGVEIQTPFSTVRIRDEGSVRTLYFVRDCGDEVAQGFWDLDRPHELVGRYARYMLASYLFVPRPSRALLLGVGPGSMLRFLQRHDPRLQVDAIEIDAEIPRIAEEYFGLRLREPQRLTVADGASFLERAPTYDVIWVDAFLKPSVGTDRSGAPLAMRSARFYRTLRRRVRAGGIVMLDLNWTRGLEDDLAAISEAFEECYLFGVPETANYVVAAQPAPGRLSAELLERRGGEFGAGGLLTGITETLS